MNIISTIAFVLVIIVVLATFLAEPKLSIQYFKACGKSGIKMFATVKEWIAKERKEVVTNETNQEG